MFVYQIHDIFTLNPECEPFGDARGKVKESQMSLGFFAWRYSTKKLCECEIFQSDQSGDRPRDRLIDQPAN